MQESFKFKFTQLWDLEIHQTKTYGHLSQRITENVSYSMELEKTIEAGSTFSTTIRMTALVDKFEVFRSFNPFSTR